MPVDTESLTIGLVVEALDGVLKTKGAKLKPISISKPISMTWMFKFLLEYGGLSLEPQIID